MKQVEGEKRHSGSVCASPFVGKRAAGLCLKGELPDRRAPLCAVEVWDC